MEILQVQHTDLVVKNCKVAQTARIFTESGDNATNDNGHFVARGDNGGRIAYHVDVEQHCDRFAPTSTITETLIQLQVLAKNPQLAFFDAGVWCGAINCVSNAGMDSEAIETFKKVIVK
jgi:hypothetical protein